MNRIYKVIWSKVKNCYIVVSEIAKSHSKPISTKLNSGKTVAAVLAVAALCAGMTTSVMAADQYYSVNDYGGYLSQMGNKNNDGAQGIGSLAAGAGATVQSKSTFQGAMATVVGSLNTVATESGEKAFDGVANSIVGVANATQNANATLIFGAGNAVSNSYGDVTLDPGSINPTDPVGTARTLGAAVGDSGGQMLVIGGANSADYARFSAITGVSNKLTGKDGNTSDYNFITGAKNTLSNTDSTYVIGSNNTVSDGTSNVVIGDKRKLTGTTNTVAIGSADEEMATTVSNATILGHNANATVADGVALGSKSVASVAKGVAGTVPTGATVSDTDKASATWTSTLGAVSVGDIANKLTRQITGVAAGTQATDAVNVAQLNAVNTKVDANALHFVQINQGTSGTNYNNDGAKGTNSIAIGKASTAANDSIIIGQGAISKSGKTDVYPIRSGDIAIGMGVQVNNYVNQGGGIAIGYNARSENMAGQQERYLSLGQTEYTTGIAIGRNTYARSGSTMVGTHNYSGAIGDVTVNTTPNGMPQPNLNPFATTVGANSFSSGTMSTVMGVYSIASSNYTGNNDSGKAPKNFGATIMGSLNSIESATADSNRAGVANSIVGLANRANNANGALIFGAGNEITNSVTPIVVPMDASIASAKDLQTNLISSIRASNSAGSTMAMGGGNKADYTQLTSIMGVNNTVTGTSDDISMYNYISGFNNTATNTDNVTVTGTNRTVSGANNTIVIGSADSTVETTASDAVAVGRNSNVTVDGGVALGANSVARIDKGVVGYDQSGKITDVSSITYDAEKYQSLQNQLTDTKTSISTLNTDITKLEAAIASYEKWYPNYEQDATWQQMQAQYKAKQDELATAKTNLDTIENEIGNTLKPLTTWQATGAAVSVGDVSRGITRQITDVAAGTNDTDAVNVAQLKAAKVEVVGSGDNVTVTSDNSEGYTKYTVAATDTKVTGLDLDKNTLTLSQNGLDDLTVKNIATTTDLANNKTHYFHVNSAANGTNYNNDGAKGANSIAIGQATTNASNSIVMGTGAKMNSYVNQPGGIAIGANSFVENMSGGLERTFDFGQAGYDDFFGMPTGSPKDPSRMTTGVAIGQNTYARSGAIMLGTHNYKGALGDVTVDSADSKSPNMTIFSTTLGANSYSNGLFSTLTGAYSIASSNYSGGTANATKNFGATINGAFNSIESSTSHNISSGIGNSVVGLANRTANSNGALIFGAGNEITNSITNITVPTLSAPDSAKGMQTQLMNTIKSSNSGGSTLAIGGANKADYTQLSSLIGVNNTLTGTSDDISQYNYIAGFKNTVTGSDNATVIGTNRTLTGVDNTIIIGSADSAIETTASDAVAIGRNTNVTVDGGAAFGANSVSSVDKGIVGYDPSGKISASISEYQNLQTEVADIQTTITTLNSEAAALQDKMDQMKQIDPNGYEQQKLYQAAKAEYDAKQSEITAAQADLDSKQSVLAQVGKTLYTWQSTAGSVSVGDVSKGITRQITGVAAGTEDTDAVNVAQLKANKVTLEKGDNVTITADVADDGSTTYTIASTDTNTVLAKGEVNYVGADGTLVLTDSDNNPVTVKGLKNIYLTGASLENGTLTLTQNEGKPITVTGIATTAELAANKVKYFSVKSELADNQNNDGAKGTNSIAIGPKAVAQSENGIALGTNVYSGGKGSIVIGSDAKVLENIALEGSIVIGKGAEAFTGGGQQEALLGMDPTNWPNQGAGGYDNPTDASRVATSIVIGTNASGRTGSIDIGDRVYKGTMGGKEITDKNSSFHVNQTTLGTNTYNKGLFSTMVGSYSIATGSFDGGGGLNTAAYGAQNFGATVLGSLNSIRSNEKVPDLFGVPLGSSYQGIANTIVGLGNITDNTNGSLVFGAGNKITNSITSISMPTSGADSVDAMVDKLQTTIKNSRSGGATLAIGGGNTADYTQASSIIGVNNTLKGTSSNISQYNALTGYNNTATNVDNVTVTGSNNTVTDTTTAVVIGDNRTLTGVNNNVVIGSADSALETTVSDAVAIGRNANVTIEGGAALGANSVARTDKGVVGYDPSGRITDAESILGSNTQYQSLQAEVTEAQTAVNDLTAKAAEYQANIDVIVSMYPDNSYEQDAGYQGIKASLESTQAQLATAQADLDSKQSALAEAGKALYTWQSTAGSVSVGDVSKGITRQITDVAAGTADTDAVNVAQLKANKVSLVQGDNVTITSAAADDGGTTYTIASTDTYTESGTYDADSKKIKFTQNDTTKNYEVDLSGLTDNIDKGLSFAGDSGDAINKQLGDTINIVGGATDVTTGNNIGVASEEGKLNVRLAKDLTGLNSVKVGDAVTLGTTGLTITNGPSVTNTGINAGNKTITNVANGVNDTDAVNVSQLNANKIHYFQVNSAANGTNYNNNGASGTDAIAIGKATAMPHNSVVIGNNAQALDSNGGKGSGDIAIGNGARINNYADQSASIALGQNAQIDNMAGQQEALFSLGQTTFSGGIFDSARIPADPSKVATGIAIGENTFVRSGGLMVGTHNYRGALGDVDVDSANTRGTGVNVNATTLGTNSYNNGAFSTITGAYSIASGNYAGGRNTTDAAKNFGATIMGSLNSVESATASSRYSGIANSIVGTANRTFNSNGSLIFGAGNEITNSITTINAPSSAGDSAKALQTTLMNSIKSSNSGGSTLAIGGGNKADYTQQSALIGVNNTLTGTSGNISQYNYITGFKNTGTNVDNVTIIGTNRTVSDAANSVVIGSADSAMTSSASDAVTIGRNANTTIDGGVALGSSSIASVDKDVAGYDVVTKEASTETSTAWKSTAAAVSVGDTTNNITRQITGVAAGRQDTDAVNVAQLKQVAAAAEDAGNTKLNFAGDDKTAISRGNGDTLNIIGGAEDVTENNISVKKSGNDTLKVQLAKNLAMNDGSITFAPTGAKDAEGNTLVQGDDGNWYTDLTGATYDPDSNTYTKDGTTVAAVENPVVSAVKLSSTGLDNGNQKITNVAAGEADTDAVNVSQLRGNRIKSGNVTYADNKSGIGTMTLTMENGDTVTVNGLQDTYVTDVTLKDHTLTITQNAGDPFVVDNIATMDDITSVSGKHTAITLNGDAPTAGANGALGEYIGSSNLTMAVKDINGQKVYDLKMSKDLVAGTPGKAGADGEPGTPGTPGSITIIGEPGKDGADGTNTSANITVKDGKNGLNGTDGITRIVYKDENGTDHEIATMDDGLNFTGDTAGVTVAKKLNETLSITGGITDTDQLTTVDNIGVVASDSGLKVRLAKDLNGLNSVRVGGSEEGKGIYIANQTVTTTKDGVDPETGNYITGLTNKTWNPTENGYVSGRAATEDQLKSVYDTINSTVKANKVVEGKNITVTELADGAGTQVALKDDITLGDASGKNVAISGTNGTITAGDGGSNQVAIDGTNSTITAGTGDKKVTVDGNSGLVTVGDTTKGAISIGNQTVTPKVVGADGTETDGTAKTGKYITGLENTTWNPTGEGYVADRAATEGQLKDIADQISNIDTAVKSSSRVFESDSGSDAGSLVTVKNTDPMKLSLIHI